MKYSQFKKVRQRRFEEVKERRPSLTNQEERFLYSLHLKTIEFRTLMNTLRTTLSRDELDSVMVEYNLRLRKAKANFEQHNFKDEWLVAEDEKESVLNGSIR